METSNLPDAEFNTRLISMLRDLSENFSNEIDRKHKNKDRNHKKEPVRREDYDDPIEESLRRNQQER